MSTNLCVMKRLKYTHQALFFVFSVSDIEEGHFDNSGSDTEESQAYFNSVVQVVDSKPCNCNPFSPKILP